MARYALASLALGFAAASCNAQDTPEEREFASKMVPRLEQALPGAQFEMDADDPLELHVSGLDDWDKARINLHRIYGFCRENSADDCETVKADFIDHISEKPPEHQAGDLRLIVRDAQYWDYVRQAIPDETKRPPHRQIGEDLYAILAFDSPKTIALAQPAKLKELGLDGNAAWVLAQRQTAAILPPLPDGKKLRHGGVAFQDYEFLPGMMTDTAAWAKIAKEAGPDMFVTAVSDDFVFVGMLPSGPKLEEFRKSVEQDCKAQPRCVSPNIYRFRNGRWMIAR